MAAGGPSQRLEAAAGRGGPRAAARAAKLDEALRAVLDAAASADARTLEPRALDPRLMARGGERQGAERAGATAVGARGRVRVEVKGALEDADGGMQALSQARARARALAHEVGALTEDLKTSEKRRARAVERSAEAERVVEDAQKRCRELEYANKQLRQQAEAASKEKERGVAEQRRTLAGFKEALANVEGQVEARASAGVAHCKALDSMLRALGGVVGAAGGHLPDVRSLFAEANKAVADLQTLMEGGEPQVRQQQPGGSRASLTAREGEAEDPLVERGDAVGRAALLAQKVEAMEAELREHRAAPQEIEALRGELEGTSAEVERLRERAARGERARDEAVDSRNSTEALYRREIGRLEAGLSHAKQDLAEAGGEIEALRARLARAQDEAAEADDARLMLQRALHDRDAELNKLQGKAAELGGKVHAASAALREAVTSHASELRDAQARAEAAQEETSSLRSQLGRLRGMGASRQASPSRSRAMYDTYRNDAERPTPTRGLLGASAEAAVRAEVPARQWAHEPLSHRAFQQAALNAAYAVEDAVAVTETIVPQLAVAAATAPAYATHLRGSVESAPEATVGTPEQGHGPPAVLAELPARAAHARVDASAARALNSDLNAEIAALDALLREDT